ASPGATTTPSASSATRGLGAGLTLARLLTRLLGRARLDVEAQLAVRRVDGDAIAGADPVREHQPRELVLDQALNRPPQRARAELRIEPLAREELHRLVGERDLDPLRPHPPHQRVEHQPGDLDQLLV